MATIDTIYLSSTDTNYSLQDPNAARNTHKHTYAAASHTHYLSSQGLNISTSSNPSLGSPNTSNNSANAGYLQVWGLFGYYSISYAPKSSIAVPALGNLSSNIHIWTANSAYVPWVNFRLYGYNHNKYQMNTDGKLYLMALSPRGSSYTQGTGMNDTAYGSCILSASNNSWSATNGPSATVNGR